MTDGKMNTSGNDGKKAPSDRVVIKKGFLFAFLLTVSIGTFQFGYSIGVFNTL